LELEPISKTDETIARLKKELLSTINEVPE
jgi:hypothetical protein